MNLKFPFFNFQFKNKNEKLKKLKKISFHFVFIVKNRMDGSIHAFFFRSLMFTSFVMDTENLKKGEENSHHLHFLKWNCNGNAISETVHRNGHVEEIKNGHLILSKESKKIQGIKSFKKIDYTLFFIRTSKFLLRFGCSYFFGTLSLKMFLSGSYFRENLGYFGGYLWECTLISFLWNFFFFWKISKSRLTIVLIFWDF